MDFYIDLTCVQIIVISFKFLIEFIFNLDRAIAKVNHNRESLKKSLIIG